MKKLQMKIRTIIQSEEGEQNDTNIDESKYPFPSNTSEVGYASIVISTPAGTSEAGNVSIYLLESFFDSVRYSPC